MLTQKNKPSSFAKASEDKPRPALRSSKSEGGNDVTRTFVTLSDDDILDAIRQIASRQNTQFVFIHHLACVLALSTDEDREFLLKRIGFLDRAGAVMLSPIEQPQLLASFITVWHVRNESGVPCHEVCIAPDSHRIARILRSSKSEGGWPRAIDESTFNPTVQQQRITHLVLGAAETLAGLGAKPQTRLRVLHVEHEGRAA